MVAKNDAAKPTTRREFAADQCHHRNAEGKPDCRKKKWRTNVNLCEQHEKIWQKAARERAKARTAAKPVSVQKPKPATPATERRAPRPPKEPVKRVATTETQPAVVQMVAPTE